MVASVRAHAAQRRIGKEITHAHNEQAEPERNPHAVHANAVGVRQPMRPNARASAGVTEYARKFMSPTTVLMRVAAMLMPARVSVPSCPTSAESASTNSGSAISAPKAGTASARIRLLSDFSGWVFPDSASPSPR